MKPFPTELTHGFQRDEAPFPNAPTILIVLALLCNFDSFSNLRYNALLPRASRSFHPIESLEQNR